MPNWTDAYSTADKVQVLTSDAQGRITSANVPGTAGIYRTWLERQKNCIWTTCFRNDAKDCLGNKESVCYHCLATILAAVKQKGVTVEWFHKLGEAQEKQRGDRLIRVRSTQSGKIIFGIIRHDPTVTK